MAARAGVAVDARRLEKVSDVLSGNLHFADSSNSVLLGRVKGCLRDFPPHRFHCARHFSWVSLNGQGSKAGIPRCQILKMDEMVGAVHTMSDPVAACGQCEISNLRFTAKAYFSFLPHLHSLFGGHGRRSEEH